VNGDLKGGRSISWDFVEGLKKTINTSVKIADVLIEILTEYLSNICLERYRYINFVESQFELHSKPLISLT
jgi:hypothetical protein